MAEVRETILNDLREYMNDSVFNENTASWEENFTTIMEMMECGSMRNKEFIWFDTYDDKNLFMSNYAEQCGKKPQISFALNLNNDSFGRILGKYGTHDGHLVGKDTCAYLLEHYDLVSPSILWCLERVCSSTWYSFLIRKQNYETQSEYNGYFRPTKDPYRKYCNILPYFQVGESRIKYLSKTPNQEETSHYLYNFFWEVSTPLCSSSGPSAICRASVAKTLAQTKWLSLDKNDEVHMLLAKILALRVAYLEKCLKFVYEVQQLGNFILVTKKWTEYTAPSMTFPNGITYML